MAESAIECLSCASGGMDLPATLFCGQSFSWQETAPGVYTGVAGFRAVRACMQGNVLHLEALSPRTAEDETFWRNYFALDMDYSAVHSCLRQDKKLCECVDFAPGIRVLRQPFFDTLLSFIISQNNHIPRIIGIVSRLRQGFGPQLADSVYGFPAPQVLAGQSLEALSALRAGFRAKYLLDAAQKVASGQVNEAELSALDTASARKKLMEINGVGPKVADCVLLFGLARHDVVPMDVWMKKALEVHFGGVMPDCAKELGGIAQQYVFAWARANMARGGDS